MAVDDRQFRKSVSDRIFGLLAGREAKWLADEVGVSESTLGGWKQTGVPSAVGTFARAAAALNVSTDSLLGSREISAATSGGERFVSVPGYTARVAAGAGQSIDGALGEPEFEWHFPKAWFEANIRVSPEDLRVLTVHGSSQEPELSSGDLVAVDTSPMGRKLRNDSMYVIAYNDELVLKRIQKIGSILRLISRNPANPPFDINLTADGDALTVVGQAVWASKML